MNTRTPLLLAAAALATACGQPDFTKPQQVTNLRVLGARAEPPEVAPPGDVSAPSQATLGALVAHPDFAADPARRATVLHIACTPAPGAAGATPCSALSELTTPTDVVGLVDVALACTSPGLGKAGGVTFAGIEACGAAGCEPVTVRRDPADSGSGVTLTSPRYEVPAAASLAALPAGHPDRVNGGEITDLVLALDAAPSALAPTAAVADGCAALAAVASNFAARWAERPGVTSLKRLRLRGPEAPSPANQNPALSGITLAGAALPAPGGVPATLAAGAKRDLLPVLPGDPAALAERYVETDADGKPVREKTEEWAYAWFTTAGELKDAYTRGVDDPEELTAPAEGPVPLLVWLVVRDLRGGVSWTAGSLLVPAR
ncbi:MAG: hypothetical protein QM704_04980 [Anaeromyxobacteraceae bacterium]